MTLVKRCRCRYALVGVDGDEGVDAVLGFQLAAPAAFGGGAGETDGATLANLHADFLLLDNAV